MRSAKAPTISAGVMMAKVIWKVMNTLSGNSAITLSLVSRARKALSSVPMKEARFTVPASMPVASKARL